MENLSDEKSVFEKIYDGDDESDIVLYDENENPVKFEQIAFIPINENDYAILKPVEKFPGMNEDEAMVFLLEETEEGEELLTFVDDAETVDLVFDIYDKLFEEETGKKD